VRRFNDYIDTMHARNEWSLSDLRKLPPGHAAYDADFEHDTLASERYDATATHNMAVASALATTFKEVRQKREARGRPTATTTDEGNVAMEEREGVLLSLDNPFILTDQDFRLSPSDESDIKYAPSYATVEMYLSTLSTTTTTIWDSTQALLGKIRVNTNMILIRGSKCQTDSAHGFVLFTSPDFRVLLFYRQLPRRDAAHAHTGAPPETDDPPVQVLRYHYLPRC
jgi:hypothetical protein